MSATLEKRVVVVGPARESRPWISALAAFPELVLDGLVAAEADRDPALRGLAHWSSESELLDGSRAPDIAILCSPPGDHREGAIALLRAGVDLLVQPPLATRTADAEELLELAERANRELTTATPMRMSSALLSARSRVEEGCIGRLQGIEVCLDTKRDAHAGWCADPERSGGGVWMQLGPHALDVAHALGGELQRLRMVELGCSQGAGVEDEATVDFELASGIPGRIRLSWNAEAQAPIALLSGENGELLVGRTQTVLRRGGTSESVGIGHDECETLRAQISEHLRRRLTLHPPIDAGPAVLAALEAGYSSLRDRCWRDLAG